MHTNGTGKYMDASGSASVLSRSYVVRPSVLEARRPIPMLLLYLRPGLLVLRLLRSKYAVAEDTAAGARMRNLLRQATSSQVTSPASNHLLQLCGCGRGPRISPLLRTKDSMLPRQGNVEPATLPRSSQALLTLYLGYKHTTYMNEKALLPVEPQSWR